MSASYQCIASGVCAYDKANDVKGTVVATFEPQQIIAADEHRAQAGRRWLRLKIQGRCMFTLVFSRRVDGVFGTHFVCVRVGRRLYALVRR